MFTFIRVSSENEEKTEGGLLIFLDIIDLNESQKWEKHVRSYISESE